jgi:sarcosine oxidase subunit alpha
MQMSSDNTVALDINGVRVTVPADASMAAALLACGAAARTSIHGEPRSALCGMGICMECRATVDGLPHVRTCQLRVRPGMKVVTE